MPPVEVPPPPSPRKYWTRRGIAVWLTERLAEDVPTLVGIDHGFSFPLRYFEVHRLKPDWSAFLDDFQRHWPTDENIYVDFRSRRQGGKWQCAHRKFPLAAADRGTVRQCQISLSFRRAGIGGEVHPRRDSLVALYSAAAGRARAFLAIRWLGHSGGTVRHCGGLSQTLEPRLCARESHW
jgi:hypothetical protein